MDREVAFKILHPPLLADRRFVQNFRLEAKTLAALRHPQIITIYEVGEIDGRIFIAMELARGASLDKAIASRQRIPWGSTLALLKPICDALDYAHSQKVVHRDLKPANILIGNQRGALLTDFGFARLMAENSASMSMSGGIVGTPGYIAPEVWEDNAADAPVDIYALGCIAYEMLTGDVLFKGQTPIQAMRAHDRGPQFPATWPEGVPAGITEVLGKALAREPRTRYASAGALWQALSDLEAQAQAQREAAQQAEAARQAAARRAEDAQREADQRLALAAQWRAEAQRALAAKDLVRARKAIERWRTVAPQDDTIEEIQAQLEQLSAPPKIPSSANTRSGSHERSVSKQLSRRDFLRSAALGLGTITGGSLLAIWWTRQSTGNGVPHSNPTVTASLPSLPTVAPAANSGIKQTVRYLSWWFEEGNRGKTWNTFIQEFNDSQKDIEIKAENIPFDAYITKVIVAAQSGKLDGDIIQATPELSPRLIKGDLLAPLDDVLICDLHVQTR